MTNAIIEHKITRYSDGTSRLELSLNGKPMIDMDFEASFDAESVLAIFRRNLERKMKITDVPFNTN